MITPRDEYFHERDDDPDWNESGWFSFMAPERRLSWMVYCGEEQEWIPINQRRRFVRSRPDG